MKTLSLLRRTFSLFILIYWPVTALSSQIELNIQIEGAGRVDVLGAEQSCDRDCNILLNQGQLITLAPTAELQHEFKAWGEQSCDSGKGAMFNDTPSTIFTTHLRPKTVKVDDFDGDGTDDLATLTLFSSQLQVALNDGAGQFLAPIQIDKLIYAGALDSSDWDGDGDMDLVVTDYGASSVYLYRNNGNGQFAPKQTLTLPLGIRAYSLAVADINRDEQPDLLIGSFAADINASDLAGVVNSISNPELGWYLNDGDSNFYHHETIDTEQGIFTLDANDMEGDGDLDIVAAAITSNQALLYEAKDGKYSQTTVLTNNFVYGVAFGDLDKDGLQDIAAVSYYATNLHMILQSSKGQFSPPVELQTFSSGPTAIDIGDMDNDGRNDLVGGLFSEQEFYWIRHESYQQCVVSTHAKRTVTAQFQPQEENSEANTQQPQHSQQSSSGGAMSIGLLLVGLLLRARRPRRG